MSNYYRSTRLSTVKRTVVSSTGHLWAAPAGSLASPVKAPVGEAPLLSVLPPAGPDMGFMRELSFLLPPGWQPARAALGHVFSALPDRRIGQFPRIPRTSRSSARNRHERHQNVTQRVAQRGGGRRSGPGTPGAPRRADRHALRYLPGAGAPPAPPRRTAEGPRPCLPSARPHRYPRHERTLIKGIPLALQAPRRQPTPRWRRATESRHPHHEGPLIVTACRATRILRRAADPVRLPSRGGRAVAERPPTRQVLAEPDILDFPRDLLELAVQAQLASQPQDPGITEETGGLLGRQIIHASGPAAVPASRPGRHRQ